MGVYMMVSALNVLLIENPGYTIHYLKKMSVVSADGDLDSNDVAIAGRIQTHENVARVFPENGLSINTPVANLVMQFPVLGITEMDLTAVMGICDLQLSAGRLIRPRSNEIMLSEEIVRSLNLQIGDAISNQINEDYYPDFVTEFTLVGILENTLPDAEFPVRAGFVSYEYLDSHELYQPRSSKLLVIPQPGSRETVNDFLEALVSGNGGLTSAHLETFERANEVFQTVQLILYGLSGFADIIITVATALVVGMINRIAIAQRLPEIGLLHAVGYHKRYLIRRLALETVVVTCTGWVAGLVCAFTCLLLFNNAQQGLLIENLANPTPLLFTLPIPLVVIIWINASVSKILNRLDTVAIVERGKLSMEEQPTAPKSLKSQQELPFSKPLSSLTFFARHRRRGLMLILATGLMVLGVAFPIFIASTILDSTDAGVFSYSTQTSIIAPSGSQRSVDPAVLAQIRAHPAVARVISVKALGLMTIIPPGFRVTSPVYAVHEQDLNLLLDVYGLRLGEGNLIQPRSNQIVLTRAFAQNRGLDMGDTVGQPANEHDSIPTELTLAGLLESTGPESGERVGYALPALPQWIGFASYEFVESHERYASVPTHALVVPVAGRELEMELWLEENIDSSRVNVTTLGTSYRSNKGWKQSLLFFLGAAETILAIVAAIGLTILNYVFFTQRRDEFGILYAVGHSRLRLVARTLKESVSVISVAWLIGAAICIAALLYVQASVYAPFGISVDFYNPAPWLFTLPIPVAVVVASVGAVAWALFRLDPVTVIEGR